MEGCYSLMVPTLCVPNRRAWQRSSGMSGKLFLAIFLLPFFQLQDPFFQRQETFVLRYRFQPFFNLEQTFGRIVLFE